ncbi:hypothetical protein [Pseudomonas fontis]|uniref:Uncharacterized protein n=1 Tax=Pseudomonas fontis TaxID=2942633 RepID=A0ABT5NMP9_9PSED|nr:hypothetical protein [Pseudomonas fontis]MDD0974847.1 hypothetical protein [Pseudomonas fontis]MDD0989288.1 hypothetical protein [Pseudomonas fontis]
MSEITRGAIGMPFEMAMGSELSRRQFHSIAQALLAERDQLKAENEALRGVMSAVVNEIHGAHISRSGNAPGHCHSIPGVWDADNGAKAGKECAWCKVWNYAVAMGNGEKS